MDRVSAMPAGAIAERGERRCLSPRGLRAKRLRARPAAVGMILTELGTAAGR